MHQIQQLRHTKLVGGAAGQDDEARAITVDGEGNIIATGYTTENSSRDYYLFTSGDRA